MLLGALGQILTVFFQDIIGRFGRFVCDPRIAADLFERIQHLRLIDRKLLEQLLDIVLLRAQQREEQMLDRDIFILHLLCGLLGLCDDLLRRIGDIDRAGLSAGAGHMGECSDLLFGGLCKGVCVDADALHELRDQAVRLLEQCGEDMHRLDRVVLIAGAERLCILHGFNGFLCHFIRVHEDASLYGMFMLVAFWYHAVLPETSRSDSSAPRRTLPHRGRAMPQNTLSVPHPRA